MGHEVQCQQEPQKADNRRPDYGVPRPVASFLPSKEGCRRVSKVSSLVFSITVFLKDRTLRHVKAITLDGEVWAGIGSSK